MKNCERRDRIRKSGCCYEKTDRKIIRGVTRFIEDYGIIKPNLKNLYRRIQIDESNFFHHYSNFENIIEKSKVIISANFEKMLTELEKKNPSVNTVFRDLMICFYKRRDDVRVILAIQDYEFLLSFIDRLKPLLTSGWNSYGSAINSNIYTVYRHEILAVLLIWFHDDYFDPNKMLEKIKYLTYLTRTAPTKLNALN